MHDNCVQENEYLSTLRNLTSLILQALFRKSDKDFDLHISKGDDEGFEKIPKRSGAKPWMPNTQDSNSDVSIDFNVQIEEGSWAGEDLTPLENTAGQPDADNSADMTINFDVNVEIESDSDPMICKPSHCSCSIACTVRFH